MALLRHCILVREDSVRREAERVELGSGFLARLVLGARAGVQILRRVGVDCGDDGEVILVFVEVGWGGAAGVVEGVEKLRVEGAEGELVDVVGEVEGCGDIGSSSAYLYGQNIDGIFGKMGKGCLCALEWSKCSPNSMYP